mgnify:FL=1|jgi:hypothetical protein|tara:strand:- start:1016 stop:1234 length:219 start_codon:yes stop_codon:yes gene_type:complete
MAKRGRPKGGTSFVNINLEQLSDLFGRRQSIPVSRVWLEKLNIIVDSAPSAVITSNEAPTEEASKIEIKLEA